MRFWLLLIGIVPLVASAQSAQSEFPASAVAHARTLYTKQVQGESLLYNGTDYTRYHPLKDEHPYFLSDDWIEGTLSYDDQVYEDTWMYYNTFTDNLIIENYNFSNNIQLIKERVQYFTLQGHIFINLNHPSIAPGFYQLAYDGETRVLVKHVKQFHSNIVSGELVHKFLEKTRYYMYKNDQYIQVNSKGSVMKLFGDNRQEVNQAFRKTGMEYSANRSRSIVMLAQLYDQLK